MFERSEDLPPSLPLSALDEVKWDTLRDAYGPASKVPQLIVDLTRDAERRKRAEWELYGNVFHQGTVYEASPFTIPFFVGLLGNEDLRLGLLGRLLAMAISYEESVFPAGVDLAARRDEQRRLDASDNIYGFDVVRTYEAVARAGAHIAALLDDRNPEVRAEAAHLLAYLPEHATRSIAALQTRLLSDDTTCASALLALAVLGRTTGHSVDTTVPDITDRGLDAQVAHACARCLLGDAAAVDVLLELTAHELPPIGTWLDGSTISIVTASIAVHTGWATVARINTIARHLQTTPWTRAPWLAGILLHATINGTPPPDEATDLTPEQRACLDALLHATAWTIDGAINVNWSSQLDAFLVPSRREDLERYLTGATLASCLPPRQAKRLTTNPRTDRDTNPLR